MNKIIELSEEFLNKYKGNQPNWGFDGLGYIVYLRTYSRRKDDSTMEDWWETVKRVVEGNFNMEAKRLKELEKLTDERKKELQKEMERAYYLIFNLVMTPPGRGLWIEGTKYSEKVGDALNNCWGISMRPQQYEGEEDSKASYAPCFVFDEAMKGGGVGINIQRKNVYRVPKVKNSINLKFTCKDDHKDYDKMKDLLDKDEDNEIHDKFKIPDSREGWVEALKYIIDYHYQEGNDSLKIDVSNIRPAGDLIKGFGGVASGPKPLIEMLDKVNMILNSYLGKKLPPVKWGDIFQLIGNCVVAGNVRRTALILIGDIKDKKFVESKDYSIEENRSAASWRWASNNSVDINEDTGRDKLHALSEHIYYNGEPGYTNILLAKKFGRLGEEVNDKNVELFNPCGEIPLPNAGACNLFEPNLPKIEQMIQEGKEDKSLYEEVMRLSARWAYRVTFRNYQWRKSRDIMQKERRIGVGVTGVIDWSLIKFNRSPVYYDYEDMEYKHDYEVTSYLDKLYNYVKKANKEQSRELEANESIKLTTVKPSGTVSLLMGISPGIHSHWSSYYIRRIRISSDSNLVDILKECNYSYEQAIKGFDENENPVYDERTLVFEFPVKVPTADYDNFKSAKNIDLWEQAKIQEMVQRYWADNSVSATLYFNKPKPKPVFFENGVRLMNKFGEPRLEINPEEEEKIINEITDLLDKYKDKLKSTTLLPYDNSTYPQMPYEEITKEEYENRSNKIKKLPWEIKETIENAQDDEDNFECSTGACPVR